MNEEEEIENIKKKELCFVIREELTSSEYKTKSQED
jgi:hypothetical protein